ncbi:MAG: hypothetical protein LBJ95_05095 [Oscillospiraceae bacterium]|jgi:hypothetical protein|nr:hypothetical protein [Oscillospiraceae bacterium]
MKRVLSVLLLSLNFVFYTNVLADDEYKVLEIGLCKEENLIQGDRKSNWDVDLDDRNKEPVFLVKADKTCQFSEMLEKAEYCIYSIRYISKNGSKWAVYEVFDDKIKNICETDQQLIQLIIKTLGMPQQKCIGRLIKV